MSTLAVVSFALFLVMAYAADTERERTLAAATGLLGVAVLWMVVEVAVAAVQWIA